MDILSPPVLPEVKTKLAHAHVVEPALWHRLVARIVKDHGFEPEVAARVMDQALGFLRLVAVDPDGMYSPSPTVDIGWHAVVLYTKDYASLCQQLAGAFIHHTPLDEPGVTSTTNEVARTVAAMKVRGLKVDEPLWDGTIGECGGYDCRTCVR